MTRVRPSVGSSHDRDEHIATVSNVVLSKEDEVSPATVTSNKGEGDGTIRSASKGRRECSLLSVNLKLKLREVCEENLSLDAAMNEYKMRVKNFEKRGGREGTERNGVTARAKQSKQEANWLGCEIKLLLQTTKGVFDGTLREASTSLRYVDHLFEVLESQYIGMEMTVTQNLK